MAYNLGNASGDIRITYDDRGVARARDSLGRFVSASRLAGQAMDDNDRSSRKFSLSLDFLGKAFLVMTKYVTLTSTAIQSSITVVHLLGAAITALAPIVAAGLATLPGLLLGIAAAVGVVKVAFMGVGDALKAAASGDAEKLAEAVKKLAPAAREFVLEIAKAGPALKPVQQAIQQAFFSGFAQQVPQVVAAIKETQQQAVGLATAFNGVGLALATFAKSPAFILAMQGALDAVAHVLELITPAIVPILNGFAQMAGNAAALAFGIQGNLLPAAERVGQALANFDIAGSFKAGMAALAPIIQLFKDLGTIIANVFEPLSAATASGNALFLELSAIVSKVAEFTKTEGAIKAFTALGEAFNAIAGAAGDAVLSLLIALAPAITAIAPLFTSLARVVGVLLTKAFEILGPIVTQLVGALNGALGPLLSIVGDAILKVFNALQPLLKLLVDNLGPILTALSPVIGALATAIGDMLAAAIRALMPSIQALLPVFVQLAEQVGPPLVQLIAALAKGWAEMAPAMIPAINILVGVLVPVLKLIIPAIAGVVQVLAILIGWLANLLAPIAAFIAKWTEATRIQSIVEGIFKGVMNIVNIALGFIAGKTDGAVNAMKATFGSLSAIIGIVSNAFSGAVNAATARIGQMLGAVRAIPGQITGAIGNLGGLLFGAGQAVIQGMVNGIASMAGRAAAAARQAVAGIPDAVKGLLGIASPSKVTMALGREVPAGLAIGILQGIRDVQSAATQAAQAVTLGMPSTLAAQVNSAVSASVAGAGTPIVNVSAPTAPAVAPVVNQNIYAAPGMDPVDVGNKTAARVTFALTTLPGR